MIGCSKRWLQHSGSSRTRPAAAGAVAAMAAPAVVGTAHAATTPVSASTPAAAMPSPSPTPPAGGAPWTVPAMQHWQAGARAFHLPHATLRVNVETADGADLGADADTFADDLTAVTGLHVVVDTNWQPPRPAAAHGDRPSAINLRLDPSIAGHGGAQHRVRVDDN